MHLQAPDFTLTASTSQTIFVRLHGDWLQGQTAPSFDSLSQQLDTFQPQQISITVEALGQWDSLLMAFLLRCQRYCDEHNIHLDNTHLPPTICKLLHVASTVPYHERPVSQSPGLWQRLNPIAAGRQAIGDICASLAFLGDFSIAMLRLLAGRSTTRFSDFRHFCYQAGPDAFPIVTLTSVLVGMILAYLGAAQLQMFGAEIYVADLVVIGMWREMAVLMVAVVMAGRTGAAYAAQLGTMQTNEEIDAITTMGISPMEFLVLPRTLALVLTLPLLTLYADVLGVIGGGLVAGGMGINMLQFLSQVESAMSLSHLAVGLFKSLVFALLIATAGCRSGIYSGRGSEAVGSAATNAVVTALVYLIVADAAINIACQNLGI
ncbi:MAG: MlaE family ABC transporter permease [Parahaliea sp.]